MKWAKSHDIIGEGAFYGCRRSTRLSLDLVEGGLVTEEDARFISTSPHDFVLALRWTLTRS